jgi:hypothetical protein
MIKVLLKHEYEFPSEWEELDQDQALRIFSIIHRLKDKKITLLHARAEFFIYLASLKIPADVRANNFWENIYLASSNFRFFFKYMYNNESFQQLSPDVQMKLTKYLPHELEQTPEVRVASAMEAAFDFDMVFGKNLITQLRLKRRTYQAYTFTNNAGFINTSLTATQYVDTLAVINRYGKEKQESHLNMLIAILFNEQPYSSAEAFSRSGLFSEVPVDFKLAVMYNFIAINEWIRTKTQYSILWIGSKSKGIPSDPSDMIYSVSKAGYGPTDQVGKYGVMELLDLMKKILIDQLRSMISGKIKPVDVANTTGIPLKLILELV